MLLLRCRAAARAAFALVCIAVVAACQDQDPPTSPTLAPRLDAAHSAAAETGNPHVHFLAPLVKGEARYSGVFDGSLSPEVLVYRGTAAPCLDGAADAGCAEEVARFTAGGQGPERVRVDERGEHYIVNWHAQKSGADRGATYRIVVRVGGQVLDHVDLDGLKGGALPIKFRIEQGALGYTGATVGERGGTVATADGALRLEIPAGALDGAAVITARALEPTPGRDDRVIAGTQYELGPDGTEFDLPVTVALRYDANALPAGVSPRLLRLHTLVDGVWALVEGSEVDTEASTVTGRTLHFSTYAVLPVGFVAVRAGEEHACGLTAAGTAWCWGNNVAGQLGAPTTDTCDGVSCSRIAVEVQGGLEFVDVEAGQRHTCGVTAAGEIYCWGSNALGQLGDGGTTHSSALVRVAGGHRFTAVSAEFQQTCAVTEAGEVYCWGRNGSGELGGETGEACFVGTGEIPCATTPQRVAIPAASQVDVGLSHACAVTRTGDVYCWGWNVLGQIGTGATSPQEPPTLVASGFSRVSAGAIHNCAIDASGAASCWGDDFWLGALGSADVELPTLPVPVGGGLSFAQVDASNGNEIHVFSCGVTTDGQALCWGANVYGQLGVGTAPETCAYPWGGAAECATTPAPVAGGLEFLSVTTGMAYACGYAADGEVYCWGGADPGLSYSGQLGNGGTAGSRVPVRVATAP